MKRRDEVRAAIDSCLDASELEVFSWRGEDDLSGHSRIKIVHRPSGREFVSSGFRSQHTNLLLAKLRLISWLIENDYDR